MTDTIGNHSDLLLQAASLSAELRRGQLRKGVDASPSIDHPFEVAGVLAAVGGVTDVTTLVATLLHDTVEDTSASPADLESHFGREVRLLVDEVTDDKKLEKAERKRLQIEHTPALSGAAKGLSR